MKKVRPGIRSSYLMPALSGFVILLPMQVAALDVNQEQQTKPPVETSDLRQDALELKSEQWDLARHGERLIRIPALKTVVNDWSSRNNHVIEIRYPGGEEGELWVRELMDWLISLTS